MSELNNDNEDLGIKEHLVMWGRWCKGSSSNANLGHQSIWSTILPSGGGGISIGDDDTMLKIEQAVAYLKAYDNQNYRLIKLKYLYGYSYQRLAQHLTKRMKEYQKGGIKAGMNMCDKHCKKLVDNAECRVEYLLKCYENQSTVDSDRAMI